MKINNFNINDNAEKVNLIKEIYKYNQEGYNVNKHYKISDNINELRFNLKLLEEKK